MRIVGWTNGSFQGPKFNGFEIRPFTRQDLARASGSLKADNIPTVSVFWFHITHTKDDPMISFILNGKPVTSAAEEDTPLLWIIRDEQGLKGTKFGCGIGMCGACTVHMDGTPLRSCSTPLGQVANASITTIEGLHESGQHPLQIAWVEAQVPQCGYCQSGQIMQAASLLQSNPRPSDQEIDAHMSGNLCRCMTYVRIREAIHAAAEGMRPVAADVQATTKAGGAV
jgi:isoquinoline 1-oxidoreductase alpha subunit